jgi:hypothetical protein
MFVKFIEEEDSIYLCTCSDWSVVTSASNENEAAKKAISYLITEYGLDINISPTIIVKKIKEKFENSDFIVRMDETLSDMGMYKESRALKDIFEK